MKQRLSTDLASEEVVGQYTALFQPIRIGSMELPNRIVQPAMHVKFGTPDGVVTQRQIDYFVERVQGGVGLSIVDNTAIDWEIGRAAGNPTRIDEDRFIVGLSDLTDAVHRAGGRIATQPHHAGRQNTAPNIVGSDPPVAPSVVTCKVCQTEPHELDEREIEAIIQRFVDAAVRSKQAGFDAVEFHGAHGYLLTQFVSPYTNQRHDNWGGSRENRFRFPLEVVRRTREAVGPDFTLTYRMNAEDRVDGGLELPDGIAFAQELEAAGIDGLHVTAGIYESWKWIFTMQGMGTGALAPLGEAVKKEVGVPVIQVGRLGHDIPLANKLVEEGRIDLVAMGRSLLTDPNLPRKVAQGRLEDVRPCIACNECVGFLFDGWRARCVVNPQLGREHELKLRPPRGRARVLVIGGGPAGMETSVQAAERGHEVTLVERGGHLGGQLRQAVVPRHKGTEMRKLLEFYQRQLERLGVDVRLGEEVTPASVRAAEYDAVVVATGAVPTPLTVPGADRGTVRDALALLAAGPEAAGGRVVVVGGDQLGVDTALWLAEQAREVTIVEPGRELLPDVNPILNGYLTERLEDAKVRVLLGAEVVEVTDGGVRVRTGEAVRRVDCDTVAVALGFTSHDPLSAGMATRVPTFVAGSAARPGKLYGATQDALEAVLQIEALTTASRQDGEMTTIEQGR